MATAKEIFKEARSKKYKGYNFSVFDFDNTCIHNDIGEATLAYMCKNGLIKNKNLFGVQEVLGEFYHKSVFLQYVKLKKEGEYKKAYEFSAKILAGYNLEEMVQIVCDTIKSEGEELGETELYGLKIAKGIKLKKDTIRLMQTLRRKRIKTWIVSASPWIVVETAKRYYGLNAQCIGIKSAMEDGKFTDKIIYPAPIIEGKVECIKKYIRSDKVPLVAVGDSINDLPMLEYSKIKVIAKDHTLSPELESFLRDSNEGFRFLGE